MSETEFKTRRRSFKNITLLRRKINTIVGQSVDESLRDIPQITATVAKKGGEMRVSLRQILITQLNAQKKSSKIKLSLSDAEISRAIVSYLKHHTKGHPDFNIHYNPNFYTDPTKPGSKPVDRTQIITDLKNNILNKIRANLKKEGIK